MTPIDLRAWRKRMGWAQREAARRLHLGSVTYQGYEAGRFSPAKLAPIPGTVALAASALEAVLVPPFAIEPPAPDELRQLADEMRLAAEHRRAVSRRSATSR